METSATLKYLRVSPQKARLVVDQIRDLDVDKALEFLTFSPKRVANVIKKLLNSAISNAEFNEGADIDELYISSVFVDKGPIMKRNMPRAKGRSDRILKRSCHITVKLSDQREVRE